MKLLVFLLLASPCFAGGPKYQHKDANLDDEIRNIYHDISSILKGDVRISSVTISSLTVTGGVGQVKQATQCAVGTSSATTVASFVPSNMTCSITPTSSSSKVLFNVNAMARIVNASARCYFTPYRGSVNLGDASTGATNILGNVSSVTEVPLSYSFLDSPNTTSATTYTMYFRSDGTNQCSFNLNTSTATVILTEIGS